MIGAGHTPAGERVPADTSKNVQIRARFSAGRGYSGGTCAPVLAASVARPGGGTRTGQLAGGFRTAGGYLGGSRAQILECDAQRVDRSCFADRSRWPRQAAGCRRKVVSTASRP